MTDQPPLPTSIVLLTGPSGSGKTSLTRRLGLPVVELDNFYRDGRSSSLPHRFGSVDWDDAASWDRPAAMSALLDLAHRRRTELPIYDIPTSRRTGSTWWEPTKRPLVIAEGIFAAELVAEAKAHGILADAICLVRPRLVTFALRLVRDLAEARKPPLTLVQRGWRLLCSEPERIAAFTRKGARPLGMRAAENAIRAQLP